MDEFYPLQLFIVKVRVICTYHLICEHQHCFHRKFPLAEVEKVLKTGPQKINNHHVVVSFDSEPMHIRNANYKNVLDFDQKIADICLRNKDIKTYLLLTKFCRV